MSLDILELGRTSFVGGALLIGVAIVAHLLAGLQLPQSERPRSWLYATLFAIGSYGLGVMIENVAERYVEETNLFWLTMDDRLRASALFDRDCDLAGLWHCSLDAGPLAEGLDRHLCMYDAAVRNSYAASAITAFHHTVQNAERIESLGDVTSVVDAIYFPAKNEAYRHPQYFAEMTEIKARSDFARSILLVCTIVGIATLLLWMVGSTIRERIASAPPGSWWADLQPSLSRRSTSGGSSSDAPSAGQIRFRAAVVFLVVGIAGLLGLIGYRAEEQEHAKRAFGYYLDLQAFPTDGSTLQANPSSFCTGRGRLREASGVAVDNRRLYFVGDESPGVVYQMPKPRELPDPGNDLFRGTIRVESETVSSFGGGGAIDLESIDVAGDRDGTVYVISERLNALLADDHVVAMYPPSMAETGGKGIEGLAIEDSLVAVLWEGGYPEADKLATGVSAAGPFLPLLCVHRLAPQDPEVCQDSMHPVALDVPQPPDDPGQAFRAPDLVWNGAGEDEEPGLIVLLSSTDAAQGAFRFKWLQQFDLNGRRVGEPVNLCAPGLLPAELHSGPASNFEGLAWFDDERLILVSDDKRNVPATAVFIDVVPWPTTDEQIACEAPSA